MRIAALVACACLALVACSGDDESGTTATPQPSVQFGAITRLPGGTAVPSDTRILTSLTCADETLTLVTDRETLTAPMLCGRLLPESITSRFIDKEIVIRYDTGRLIVESTTEGTLEFPAGEPRVMERQ